ncbi:YafY family protein [Aureimonas sp. AU20]|uniref:helix-turn-helix transcriptional regulator n=1 Tax=Aureimonas sp. AU20 TaxID=1349819 RepID=UPI000720DE78|nr:YafY family protein [Aureimonas sp. AU20]ALN72173.1 hypothetical protein M673_05560 [Aureimonas sp. AU20]
MSRSERLLDLLALLRRHRQPVSGHALAETLGVSLRTLYRDIASLQALGAEVEGEAGVGYVLRPGFHLPPLMFRPEELEALALGSRWVAGQADPALRDAALSALSRIAAVLPPELRAELDASSLMVGPGKTRLADSIDPALLRLAIRRERKLRLAYQDAAGSASDRVIWPFALAFFEGARILLGWCEMRGDFRHFRTDRIASAELLDERSPRRRAQLLKEWRLSQGIVADRR